MMKGVAGYILGSRGPSGFGSSSTAENVAAGISLNSKVIIVTGATSGIGYETARVLAKHGAHLVIPARKLNSCNEVKAKILKEFPQANISVAELDLSSLASVKKFADDFKAMNLPLSVLINNAGMEARKFDLSPDGLELDFATNHIGHFFLTNLLLDKMKETARKNGEEGRIVILSSEAHKFAPKGGVRFDKLNDEKSFSWMPTYGQSKLANLLHARELSRRLQEEGSNVTVNAIHPGIIPTNLTREFNSAVLGTLFFLGSKFLKNIPQGAATTVYAAIHPSMKGVTGKYYCDCNEAEGNVYAKDMKLAAQLWDFSESFIKEHS